MNTKIKILNSKDLIETIKKERVKNKIILCHGVFDVLHLGHIKYLESAKRICKEPSKLIVSITSDLYVKKNKGQHRPYFNQKTRSEFLRYIKFIDYIYVCNDETAIQSISLIKPDYYVKGPDYKIIKKKKSDINLEREIKVLKKFGGKFELSKGITYSSSNIINYNLKKFNDEQINFIKRIKRKYDRFFLDNFLNYLKKPNILVIGEAILDEYVFTSVLGKSSKESIINTKKINSQTYLGGSLAIANHLCNISNKVKLITYLGKNDKNNNFIKKKINKNIKLDYIEKNSSPTILKKRYLDDYTKNKLFGSYNLNDSFLNKQEELNLLKKIKKNINNYDFVIAINYNHGLWTPKILDFVQKKSKFLVFNSQLNSSNSNTYNLNNIDNSKLLCIQELEARSELKDRESKTNILLKKLFKKNKHKNLIITSGSNGSFYKNLSEEGNCPAFAANVVDRVGAGDIFFLVASFLLWNKIPLDLTNLLSNIAASLKITNIGHSYNLKFSDIKANYLSILK